MLRPTVSDEFGDIDSGETRSFDPAKSCVVSVRPGVVVLGRHRCATTSARPHRLSFQVEFWEKDPIGHPPGFCGTNPPGPGRHVGPHCLDDHNGDDFIGRAWSIWRRRSSRQRCLRSATNIPKLSSCFPAKKMCAAASVSPTTLSPTASRACLTCASTSLAARRGDVQEWRTLRNRGNSSWSSVLARSELAQDRAGTVNLPP